MWGGDWHLPSHRRVRVGPLASPGPRVGGREGAGGRFWVSSEIPERWEGNMSELEWMKRVEEGESDGG